VINRWIEERRRYRRYEARVAALPAPYGDAVEALWSYLMLQGPANTEGVMQMLEDLADLFEQSAAAGVGVRGVVGDDPVAFADAWLSNYPRGDWLRSERERLVAAIERAAAAQLG
jgi:DNA-binding ferritin-like protein (Dps family)